MAALDRAPIFISRNDRPSFRTAAESYLEHGGETRYLPALIAHFGDVPVEAITPFDSG